MKILELFLSFTVYLQVFIAGSLLLTAAIIISKTIITEPLTSIKVLIAVILPFLTGVGVPYLFNQYIYSLPLIINIVIGLLVWGYTQTLIDKHVDLRFKDEK